MRVSFVTMPHKDPEKRREFEKRWREKNREKLRAKQRERKRVRDLCVRELRVVVTPLTRDECQVPIVRLQRRKDQQKIHCSLTEQRNSGIHLVKSPFTRRKFAIFDYPIKHN